MADATMVTLTIEGRQVQVPAGTNILEAAKVAGVLVPHYCYHPGLPVAGVCRMCLVEVEKAPKLAPACATSVAEGQVVHVHSEQSLKARQGVLELLLINHPLDCPICDQAGECELQDYTFREGRSQGRLGPEPKRFNPVEDFGGDVLYVPNRCILCTRCVRFMDDVVHEPVLNVSERGDRAVIGKFEGADLTNEWASNVVDLCPVGALLSKDFLNKARAWELDRTPSICPNCTQGCNSILETRDNVVVRMRPRSNAEVNQWYLCETGRLDYKWLNPSTRLEAPLVRQARQARRRRLGSRHPRRGDDARRRARRRAREPDAFERVALPRVARRCAHGREGRVPRGYGPRSAAPRRSRSRAARRARRERARGRAARLHEERIAAG